MTVFNVKCGLKGPTNLVRRLWIEHRTSLWANDVKRCSWEAKCAVKDLKIMRDRWAPESVYDYDRNSCSSIILAPNQSVCSCEIVCALHHLRSVTMQFESSDIAHITCA